MNCNSYVNCPPSGIAPLIGYDADSGDTQTFSAMGFGPVTPPPLNWNFGLLSGFAIAQSVISQDSAAQLAEIQATKNAEATWTSPGVLPPIEEESYPDWWLEGLPII